MPDWTAECGLKELEVVVKTVNLDSLFTYMGRTHIYVREKRFEEKLAINRKTITIDHRKGIHRRIYRLKVENLSFLDTKSRQN